ncbi:uncharacterized protein LOC113685964 [Pocillopora damicornis]|uniref:uncharacterized protein LOC113685964 n=1 Tax=Pocillopora damicornis TaxID=46731 RepID=UPI000F550A97|nr:uncharacterized protein LOC113685964 [Pocillopora damicornis]
MAAFATSCSDRGYFCWIWKTTGKCKRTSDYAVYQCQKTCNFCPVPTEAPKPTDIPPTFTTTDQPSECHLEKLLPISRERVRDKQLQGHVIYHQSVVSEIQCEDLCLRIPRCLAYNYQYSGKHDENERACELMNSVVDVKSSVGFSFRLFERNRANKYLFSNCLGDT